MESLSDLLILMKSENPSKYDKVLKKVLLGIVCFEK